MQCMLREQATVQLSYRRNRRVTFQVIHAKALLLFGFVEPSSPQYIFKYICHLS